METHRVWLSKLGGYSKTTATLNTVIYIYTTRCHIYSAWKHSVIWLRIHLYEVRCSMRLCREMLLCGGIQVDLIKAHWSILKYICVCVTHQNKMFTFKEVFICTSTTLHIIYDTYLIPQHKHYGRHWRICTDSTLLELSYYPFETFFFIFKSIFNLFFSVSSSKG